MKPRSDGRSQHEQMFDQVMEKSFTLPYPGTDITTINDIMTIEVPVPKDTKYRYSFEKRIEEDDKMALHIKHLKELAFFLRAHHLYCDELSKVRYLNLKRVKNWPAIVRMARAMQIAKGITYKKESELYDVFSKSEDTITFTGKEVFVSENGSDILYGMIDRANLEYAIKVGYNTDKEFQPDPAQDVCDCDCDCDMVDSLQEREREAFDQQWLVHLS